MGWEVVESQPNSYSAMYYLVLPEDNKVLYSYDLDNYKTPMEWLGDFNSFRTSQGTNTPYIPIDTHHAMLLEWVDLQTMSRNRPYLDETIKAAIALVA